MQSDNNNHSTGFDPFWLRHQDRRNRTHFGRRPSRRERQREEVLRDWFGPQLARGEIQARQQPAVSINEPLDDLMRELGRGRQVLLEQIRDKWSELVGADIARQSRPLRLYQQCLEIEVDHATWLYELQMRAKTHLTERLEQFSRNQVRSLRFLPAGRRKKF